MSFESPVSVLFNADGNEIATIASQSLSASQPGLMIMGSGSNGSAQFFRLSPDGALMVSGALSIGGVTNVSMSNSPVVNQGSAAFATTGSGWFVRLTDGTQVIGTGSSAPVWITGSVTTNASTVATQSVYVAGWLIGVTASVSVGQWATGVTASTIVGGWATGVTASTVIGGWATGVTASTYVGQWANNVTASTREIGASTATVSSTLAANGLVGFTLLSANQNRKGATFFMDGNRIAFLKLGTGADVNTFTIRMSNLAYWELPFDYTGAVTVTFLTGSATARIYVTDVTV